MNKIAEIEPYERQIRELKLELRKSKAKITYLKSKNKELSKPNIRYKDKMYEIQAICRNFKISCEEKIHSISVATDK